jgi:putative ABC transport system permease protein
MYPGFEGAEGLSAAPDLTLLQTAIYLFAIFMVVLFILTMMAFFSLPIFFAALGSMELGLKVSNNFPDPIGKYSKIFGLVFRSLRRNLLRTALTYVALFVLTGMLTFIFSIVDFLGKITQEKEDNVQVIMTERFSVPSRMPRGYANQLRTILQQMPEGSRPKDLDNDFMVWSFIGGSLDPEKRTQENTLFLLALEPNTILTMLDYQGLSKTDLSEEGYQELVNSVNEMKKDKRNIIVGRERLEIMGKKVGDTVTVYSLGLKDVKFEVKIVGTFPAESRWTKSATMRLDYFNDTIDVVKPTEADGQPMRTVNLVWVRMPNKAAYERLASIVNDPKTFSNPQVKLETASAGISSFLDAYKDIFWGMKYLVMPAIMVIMCLVVSITITIGVRERRTEMAVMKVLGFQPWQVLSMIILEAVLIGVFGGMLSTWLVYFGPQLLEAGKGLAGIKFQIAFFNNFKAPWMIVVYGPVLGVLVGVIGSVVPAWSSRKAKVSEVFSQVT